MNARTDDLPVGVGTVVARRGAYVNIAGRGWVSVVSLRRAARTTALSADRRRRARVDPLPGEVLRSERIEGYWEVGEAVYVVKVAVHGSGRFYAKRLDPETFEWDYVPSLSHDEWLGAIRAHGRRLTRERAGELGKLYGVCIICGATLTNEDSIERGYGPVCAMKLQ